MTEEFQESDVVFEGEYCVKCVTDEDKARIIERKKVETKDTKIIKPEAVDIPVNMGWFRCIDTGSLEYEEEGEMVPPHVMVRRRLQEKMAFSVCSGIGRTLKGRDLSEMRNSVLRMTGFLET